MNGQKVSGYFDYNATTPVSESVAERMVASLSQFFNASSSSKQAQVNKTTLQAARASVAKLLNCQPEQVAFTSGGSEANNWAIKGSLLPHIQTSGHIITTAIEHPSVLETVSYLERAFGFNVTRLKPQVNGAVSLADLKASVRDNTLLISVMHANNESGVIQPVEEIADFARDCGIKCHVDAVQVVGKRAVDLDALGADYVSCSAHKFYGPKGIGCLYIREPAKLEPLIHGGGQEMGMRAGTENLTAIAGMAQAAEDCIKFVDQWDNHYRHCKIHLMEKLLQLPFEVQFNGDTAADSAVSNTINFSIQGVRAEALSAFLDRKYGIQVSIGSACSNNDKRKQYSHVLTAMGLDEKRIQGALRVSFGRYTDFSDIDHFVMQLERCVDNLLQISEMA